MFCGTEFPIPSSSEKPQISNALETASCHGNDHLGYKFVFVTSQREK